MCGATMIFFLLACQQFELAPFTPEYETANWQENVSESLLLSDQLVTPIDFLPWKQGWLVVDQATGSLIHIDEQGETFVVHEDLDAPTELLATNEGVFISCTNEILHLSEDEDLSTVADNLLTPRQLIEFNSTLHWLEGNTLHSLTSDSLIEDLAGPYDLLVYDDSLMIATQEDRKIWRWSPPEETLEEYLQLTDIPHQFAIEDDQMYLTTRSAYWPFGGWILQIDQQQETRLSESPPEPEQIIVDNARVFWASKQSITMVGDTHYTTIAQSTSVGSMQIMDGHLIWTDMQAGELRMVELAD